MSNCLVVLSGGQDSTICLYWAKQNFEHVHSITFDYGQRHRIEIKSAQKIAALAGVESHQLVTVDKILRSRSPLTSKDEQLTQYQSFTEMERLVGSKVETTFVPMRNAFFLTIAANYALQLDCFDVVTGVCEEDNANYPDCRSEFITQQQQTVNLALGIDNFTIHTPLMFLRKSESIRLAMDMDGCMDALAYSHTAYDGQYPPVGHDHATILRAEGFLEADVPDPLVVRAWREGLMPLPETHNYVGIKIDHS